MVILIKIMDHFHLFHESEHLNKHVLNNMKYQVNMDLIKIQFFHDLSMVHLF